MSNIISKVDDGSPAAKAGVRVGERLIAINGNVIKDVLDYKYYSYESRLKLELVSVDGKSRERRVIKREGEELGIEFETYLMDKARHCANRCVFCFIDQLPKGMRNTMYFKDDDARLSFLLGNYITMTNLSEREVKRMIDLRISPINISVHTTNPELRSVMLGNPRGGASLKIMQQFYDEGLIMNCQIVLCPGMNDGEELKRTLNDLVKMHPVVNSISVVPVGLTKYRKGLYPLREVDEKTAKETITLINSFGDECVRKYDYRVVYASDEMYLKARIPIPDFQYYDDYPQLENGVGMMRLFEDDFKYFSLDIEPKREIRSFSIATGKASAEFINRLLDFAPQKWHNIPYNVYSIENKFFGEKVTVAGLVTGCDLIEQLKDKKLGERLIIPDVMLRDAGDLFLDDVSIEQVERELGVEVQPTGTQAEELLRTIAEV